MACWLIKGKPSRNDLSEMLVPGRIARWVTRKPPRAWQGGDPLLFWKAAPSLCLIGAGEILSIEDADEDGNTYFSLTYLTHPLPQTVSIDTLRHDNIVGDASFLKAGAAGTRLPSDGRAGRADCRAGSGRKPQHSST